MHDFIAGVFPLPGRKRIEGVAPNCLCLVIT
jgi:hypothetical protein